MHIVLWGCLVRVHEVRRKCCLQTWYMDFHFCNHYGGGFSAGRGQSWDWSYSETLTDHLIPQHTDTHTDTHSICTQVLTILLPSHISISLRLFLRPSIFSCQEHCFLSFCCSLPPAHCPHLQSGLSPSSQIFFLPCLKSFNGIPWPKGEIRTP